VLCRDMGGMSYEDVQHLPGEVRRFWMAFRAGEAQAARELRKIQEQKDSVVYVK
jgi:hypothetical protein